MPMRNYSNNRNMSFVLNSNNETLNKTIEAQKTEDP